jgi:hypothetical protein
MMTLSQEQQHNEVNMRHQNRLESLEDEAWDAVLDRIIEDPEWFADGYELCYDESKESCYDLVTVKTWAQNMKRDSAYAQQQAGEHHAALLKAFHREFNLKFEQLAGE